ncbi:hypothetical protein S58_57500 [Bradyrhizobium oligotrophicum S58]|uniref:Uncharacterized protein n=1 Tax=Bradyrhizobium oligotrophicum S58 TaxID=1245469 RepID=M4ZD53_9BRAD|nr:hypothetical protein S58_57500 [Bradyrhizobium oligotrophicum S58]
MPALEQTLRDVEPDEARATEDQDMHGIAPSPRTDRRWASSSLHTSWPGAVPAIHVVRRREKVDARAFAALKGLRPRRRVKPEHDD